MIRRDDLAGLDTGHRWSGGQRSERIARPAERSAGGEPRRPYSTAGAIAFTIDVAGQDEATASPNFSEVGGGGRRAEGVDTPDHNGTRDSTTLSIIGIDLSTLKTHQAPTYRVVERHAWRGDNHVAIFGKLKALAESWRPRHIVIDATGVGEGLWAMLHRAFPTRVTPVKFTQQSKSEIGYRFLSIIETGRFQDCSHSPLPDGERDRVRGAQSISRPGAVSPSVIDAQYAACIAEVLPGPQKIMRWGVPEGTRDENGELIHDDFVIADSLVSILDALNWSIGGPPIIVPVPDPFGDLSRLR